MLSVRLLLLSFYCRYLLIVSNCFFFQLAVTGFGFSGLPTAQDIVQNIANKYLSVIAGNTIYPGAGADTDNGPLVEAGMCTGMKKGEGYGQLL